LLLPLAAALAVAAVAAVVAVLTMPHHDVTDAAGQKQLDVGAFTFHYPATWHKIKAGDHKHPPEAAVPSVFLASIPMRGNCARTSDGIACGNWPPGRLANGGLVVSFREPLWASRVPARHGGRTSGVDQTGAAVCRVRERGRGLRAGGGTRGGPGADVRAGGRARASRRLLAGAASDHDQALAAIDHMLATATFHS
jgi:hypothetical protein